MNFIASTLFHASQNNETARHRYVQFLSKHGKEVAGEEKKKMRQKEFFCRDWTTPVSSFDGIFHIRTAKKCVSTRVRKQNKHVCRKYTRIFIIDYVYIITESPKNGMSYPIICFYLILSCLNRAIRIWKMSQLPNSLATIPSFWYDNNWKTTNVPTTSDESG